MYKDSKNKNDKNNLIDDYFKHEKREYLDDFYFSEDTNTEKKVPNKENKKNTKISQTEIIKTSKPINVPLRMILFIFKVIFLVVLCFLIFSVSRYNYLQEKDGGDVITIEGFVENVKDSTIHIKE